MALVTFSSLKQNWRLFKVLFTKEWPSWCYLPKGSCWVDFTYQRAVSWFYLQKSGRWVDSTYKRAIVELILLTKEQSLSWFYLQKSGRWGDSTYRRETVNGQSQAPVMTPSNILLVGCSPCRLPSPHSRGGVTMMPLGFFTVPNRDIFDFTYK